MAVDIRFLNQMKKVLYSQKWAEKAPNFELYYMYRGLKKKNGLRYDITVIPPKTLGKEFVKTKGHEHNKDYGELYIVLQGRAIFLIQKMKNKQIKDVYAVKAGKGNAVIIPSHYGHVTINPSKKQKLKIANWLSEKCRNNYSSFEKYQGAGYYYTEKGWTKNKNYANLPKLRFKRPLKKIPKSLDFLHGSN